MSEPTSTALHRRELLTLPGFQLGHEVAPMNHVRIRAGECATPRDVLVRSIESGNGHILVEADALPPLFFDLSSGAAGDLVQGLANHRIRMGVVVPELHRHSDAFQAFVKEANRGRAFRFFESDAEAEEWLREDEAP